MEKTVNEPPALVTYNLPAIDAVGVTTTLYAVPPEVRQSKLMALPVVPLNVFEPCR